MLVGLAQQLLQGLANLLALTGLSLLRMVAALILSLAFSLAYGLAAASRPKAEKILIPALDVLQSVPILGFFPAAVYFFIALFRGSALGLELAAIFLIFTSMAWNMTFAVYESVKTLPGDLIEVADSFRLKGYQRFKDILFPACIPKLVYNSIMSWSGGWYFLAASEIISLGSAEFTLAGIGSHVALLVYRGDLQGAFLAFAIIVTVIIVIDILFWRPLEVYAARFVYEYVGAGEAARPVEPYFLRVARSLVHFPISRGVLKLIEGKAVPLMHSLISHLVRLTSLSYHLMAAGGGVKALGVLLLAILLSSAGYLIAFRPGVQEAAAAMGGLFMMEEGPVFVAAIPMGLITSLGRLSLAYLLAVAWTLPMAFLMYRSDRAFRLAMPAFQVMAAIPATLYFPFVVLLVIGLPFGHELSSLILILSGMQWYLLFNVVGALKSIPADIKEVGQSFNLRGFLRLKRITFPAIVPSFVTGSITAWGGGWNALIVSEYIVMGGDRLRLMGIGSLISTAAYEKGNVVLLLTAVGAMAFFVTLFNRLVWRRLYALAELKFRL